MCGLRGKSLAPKWNDLNVEATKECRGTKKQTKAAP